MTLAKDIKNKMDRKNVKTLKYTTQHSNTHIREREQERKRERR